MSEYRLYFLDAKDHIAGVLEFTCTDDVEAAAYAVTHGDGRPMELWNRDRQVRRFDGAAQTVRPELQTRAGPA